MAFPRRRRLAMHELSLAGTSTALTMSEGEREPHQGRSRSCLFLLAATRAAARRGGGGEERGGGAACFTTRVVPGAERPGISIAAFFSSYRIGACSSEHYIELVHVVVSSINEIGVVWFSTNIVITYFRKVWLVIFFSIDCKLYLW